MTYITELERIFSDAHVVDFDLSQWDKLLELWVLADHYERDGDRLALLRVCFFELESIQLEFNNIGVELKHPWEHCQWNICELTCTKKSGSKEFYLLGSGVSPHITLQCKRVTYEKVSHRWLDKPFPNWNKPSSPLARPSIEELYKLFVNKK